MKLKLTLILLLMHSFISANAQQEIPPPGWTKAENDLKKYEHKFLKQIGAYGFQTLAGFTCEKRFPQRENQGAYAKYSRSSFRCYANFTSTYSDVWPADWYVYPFLAKSPENEKGESYEFIVNVRYSRSSFKGDNGCIGTLKNSYSFHAITSAVDKISGNELSNEKMRKLLFWRLDYDKKLQYSYEEVEQEGITRIDSVIFVQDHSFTHSNKFLQEYDVTMFAEYAKYDDYLPELAQKRLLRFRVRFEIEPGKEPQIYITPKGEEEQRTLSVKDYPNCQTSNAAGCENVYQNYVSVTVPVVSKKNMNNVLNGLETNLEDEKLVQLFQKPEDLTKLSEQHSELTKGMWTIHESETQFWVDKYSHTKGWVMVKRKVERNLTKDQQKAIKGNVSKASEKAAKYHQSGYVGFKVHFENVGGDLRISNVELINQVINK
ncbi:MAG: hypothetical protein ACFHU9_09470 [Fluviicola sp.]